MHSRSVKDKLHRDQVGQWVRLPDDIPASGTTDSNRIFLVAIDLKSMSQGAGDWITPKRTGHRYFSGSLGTISEVTPEVEDIWVLPNDHQNDPVDTSGDDDVDWPWLPGLAVFKGIKTDTTWNPADAQDDDYENPPAWNDTETTYGNEGGDINTVIHDGFFWEAAVADISANSEPADANGDWTKGEAVEDDDIREVYRIDPIPPGPIPGYVTEAVDAASGQGGDTPTFETATFQCYIKDEGGSWTNGPLLEGVQYNLEEGLEAGTLGLVNWGYSGFWLMPSCGVGSGYSSE